LFAQIADLELSLAGEDQRSVDKNISAIQAEWKKTSPDHSVLRDKMKRTIAARQKLCLESPVKDVLDKFPCLQQHFYVSTRTHGSLLSLVTKPLSRILLVHNDTLVYLPSHCVFSIIIFIVCDLMFTNSSQAF
jgi:hypothetical protein